MSDPTISIEPFLGIWELDADASEYELGAPPQSGTYQLVIDSASEPGQIAVAMDWTDATGKDFHMVYFMTPDGQDHAYPNSPAVDAVATTLLDAQTLETVSKKDGQPVARGLRELSDDGKMMRITQSGKTPDGGSFKNVAIYLKRAG